MLRSKLWSWLSCVRLLLLLSLSQTGRVEGLVNQRHGSAGPSPFLLNRRAGAGKAAQAAGGPMITLTKVFSAHRFIAGPFGVLLLGFPSELNRLMAMGRDLPAEERFCLQNWGCFCIAVGYIAHGARSFELQAQREVAKGMVLCFACATGLYTYTLGTNQLSPDYVRGAAATGSIFVGLLGAYSAALFLDTSETETVKRQ